MRNENEIKKKYYEMLQRTKGLEQKRDGDDITHEERIVINNILNTEQYPMNALIRWVLEIK